MKRKLWDNLLTLFATTFEINKSAILIESEGECDIEVEEEFMLSDIAPAQNVDFINATTVLS